MGAEQTPPSEAATPSDSASVAPPHEQAKTPQRDLVDLLCELFSDSTLTAEPETYSSLGIAWSLLPTLSYNPVYGFAFGASVAGAGSLGSGPRARPSALTLAANYSTTGQLQAQFRSDINMPGGSYLLRTDIRYLDTQRSTWGLGPIASSQGEYPMEFNLVRLYATLYRRTAGPVFVGVGYHFDEFLDIVDSRAVGGASTPFGDYSGPGVTSTRASGLSINLLGDTRDNLVNPVSGFYLSGSLRNYKEGFGSDKDWQEFWIDVRMYPRLPQQSNNILAFWLYSWLSFGPAPYLNLPTVGWDTYGRGARGYLQGRIRGTDQMYFETEYRFQLTRDGLLGGVVFYNGTATTVPGSNVFAGLDHAVGAGLRIKFNKRSRTNLAIDHAWGKAGSSSLFLGMTEVF